MVLEPRRDAMPDTIWNDVRCAVRSLRRTPMFTAAALVTLAVGIGGNTAVFSLVNAVMLRTLAVAAPEGLVFVGHHNPSDAGTAVALLSNPPWLQRLREESGIFVGVAAYNIRDFKVDTGQRVEQVVGQYATGNYHALIGVPMALGRGFTSESDVTLGAGPIAVISDSYWQRRYRRSPDALGSRLVVGGHDVTIIGVTAEGFEGLQPGRSIEITLPLSVRVQDEPDFLTSLDSWTNMPLVARLRPGVSAAAAEPLVDAAFQEHMASPGIGFGRARDGRFQLQAALLPAARGADRASPRVRARPVLALILAATGVYGVIAFDVARRTREIGIRVALGAQRRRVIGTVLGQVALMVLPGVAAGVAASLLASPLVETLLFGIAPRDAWTLLMAATALAVVGFVAASIPARRAASVDPAVALRRDRDAFAHAIEGVGARGRVERGDTLTRGVNRDSDADLGGRVRRILLEVAGRDAGNVRRRHARAAHAGRAAAQPGG
jgi:hypothetical protein